MEFSELAKFFEKLEKTSSRLSLIDILSDLFKKSSKNEIEKIVYLIQGRIAPFFEPLELGMAEKQVAAAIAHAFEIDKDKVFKVYNKVGDMGIAIEKIAKDSTHPLNDSSKPIGNTRLHSEKKSPSSAENFDNHGLKRKMKSSFRGESRPSVSDIFEILTKIAKTSGEGTVEKRQILLSDVLKKVDMLSAKYLVRIPLGNLRLGTGDPTILDGLAKAKLGDKTKRKLLEGAYNRTSDLGLIAHALWNKGLPAVEKLKVQVGKPIRSELCERLPTPEKVIEKMGIVDSQYKFDGFRVQIHLDRTSRPTRLDSKDLVGQGRVSMYSRNLENMTHMFPELIEATLKQVNANTAILDTEALAYNPDSEEFLPFQETTKRRRKHNIEETAKKLPLKAFVFDILYKNGKSLIDKPLKERLKIIKETIRSDDVLIPSKTQEISDPKELSIMLDDAISKGLEGVVVKKTESLYEAGGRNFNWVKLKKHSDGQLQDTIDCVVLGYIFGKGKRTAFGAGALLVGIYDKDKDEFVTVSKIGTGLTDEEWKQIKAQSSKLKAQSKPGRVNSLIVPSVWVTPKIVIEVLADEITRSPIHTAGANVKCQMSNVKCQSPGYALRFPRLVSFRDKDKKPEDATTVKELIKMYEDQGKA
jgi:DNA ligase 1